MNKFKNYVLMAAGFAVLAAVISGVIAGPAIAQAVKAALVKNIDEPGRTPYQVDLSCSANGGCMVDLAAVPNNRRLVVQYISIQLNSSTSPPRLLLTSPVLFPLISIPVVFAEGQNYIAAQALTAFYDSGKTPEILCGGTGINFGCQGTIVGYLVDLTP